jgi:hypothetical protein
MKHLKKLLTAALLLGALASCGETPTESAKPSVGTSVEESTEIRELDAKLAKIAENKTCYLTTTGQADLDTVNNLFKLSGVASLIQKDNLLEASNVAEGSVVFLTLGNSGKGLGAAGIDKASEKARAEAFAAAAKEGKITLVLFHVGGTARRGDSDEIIEVAFPGATACFITGDGNTDNFFTDLASTNSVDLYSVADLFGMVDYVKGMFGK